MKSRIAISVVFVLMAAAAFAADAAAPTAQSDAQKSFNQIKSLAGTWEGAVSTVPKVEGMGDNTRMQVSLRVTSRGNALVHEMKGAGDGDDPTKYDHPVTMFYLDNDRLLLTHYCDAGNRPRMAARTSADGKTVEFDFVDVAGSTAVRTHGACSVHYHRRQPSHRRLDLPDAWRQADACAHGFAADQVTTPMHRMGSEETL